MSDIVAYSILEAFCAALAANLLWKLNNGSEVSRDIRNLRYMIIDYLIQIVTDTLFYSLIRHIMAASIIWALSLSSAVVGCFLWYKYIKERLYPNKFCSKRAKLMEMIPVTVMCMLNMISIFTGWVFRLNGGSDISGSLFWLQCAVNHLYLLISIILIFAKMIKSRFTGRIKEYVTYLFYITIAVIIAVFEADFPENVPALEIGIYLVIQNMFLSLYVEAEKDYVRKKREIDESRISIMLSQIQPHFIYNVLAVIQDMCHGKAPEAEETTVEFARYLRGNIDSLGQRQLIAFKDELDHTMSYLALEKKRFGEDTLDVKYDIREKNFNIPTLTLQPLVENAVHYGVMKCSDGGSIVITAEADESNYIVRVTDDGEGFDPSVPKNDGRIHVGINNVRVRLKEMCGGTLNIISAPGEGTTAEILIPKSK